MNEYTAHVRNKRGDEFNDRVRARSEQHARELFRARGLTLLKIDLDHREPLFSRSDKIVFGIVGTLTTVVIIASVAAGVISSFPDTNPHFSRNPMEIIRGAFNYVLTPIAVIGVFSILVWNIIRIIRDGFHKDDLEGYQRIATAVLPFAFLIYAMMGGDASSGLSDWFQQVGSMPVFIASVVVGAGTATEIFRLVTTADPLIKRLLLLFLSGVTCFGCYMFLDVGIGPGVNVVFGLLVGICGASVFPNRE